MTRPKALYRYVNYGVNKHEPGKECAPKLVAHNEHGDLWRCRRHDKAWLADEPTFSHDFYGYTRRKSAKSEEIVETKKRIGAELQWLNYLTRSTQTKS